MADLVAGIAPQIDTYANWVSANPTLGKDASGKSFSQMIFATGSPVGDILIWGNDETFTTAYAAGQYVVNGAKPIDTDQLCKAWVNFDGTTNVGGFCTIGDSYNVTSVTDNGTGDYTILFTNAMTNANYSVGGIINTGSGTAGVSIHGSAGSAPTLKTTTQLRIDVLSTTTGVDAADVNIQIFGS